MKKTLFIIYFLSILISDSFNMDLLSHLGYNVVAADITGFEKDGREFAVMGLSNAATFDDWVRIGSLCFIKLITASRSSLDMLLLIKG